MKTNKKLNLVPELRFSEFKNNSEWKTRTIKEFIIERNETPLEDNQLFSLTIEGGVTPKTERYERAFLVNNIDTAYKLVLPNDFAYNPMNLRFGAIAKYNGNIGVALSKYYNIFYCDDSVDSRFCEILFKSPQILRLYNNISTGTLIEKKRVHFSDFKKLKIHFPKKEEQQKIADCLSSLDELINAENNKLQTLKVHKKGLMQQLFPADGETVPKLRFKEFENDGDWEEKTLGNILSEPQQIEEKEPNKLELLTVKLHCKGVENTGKYPAITRNGRPYYKRFENEILIGRQNFHNGGIGLVKKHNSGLICSNAISSFNVKKDNLYFVFYFITRKEYYERINDFLGGTGQKETTKSEFQKLNILLPKLAEQQKIADCLSSIDEIIGAQEQKTEALKLHKKGLMQGLFPTIQQIS